VVSWLLDAVARHATAASSDLFCVPFRGARQRARLPTVQTTPPAAPGALYSAFAPQAVLRALPLPAARAEACGCRPPPARRLRVRRRLPHAARPPNTRLTLACRVCRLQPESEVVPYRAGASRGAERRGEARASPPPKSSACHEVTYELRRSWYWNWSARCGVPVRCNLHGCIGEGRAKRGFGQRCSSVRSARQRADRRNTNH
jgi:hypothetical protein